jgi:hypothetical protein
MVKPPKRAVLPEKRKGKRGVAKRRITSTEEFWRSAMEMQERLAGSRQTDSAILIREDRER